jgi:hypothetical protein
MTRADAARRYAAMVSGQILRGEVTPQIREEAARWADRF